MIWKQSKNDLPSQGKSISKGPGLWCSSWVDQLEWEEFVALRVIPYKLHVSFLTSPHGSSSAIKHLFYYIHICFLKKHMFSIPLLDTFLLNKAKTNPAIDLFRTSEQGSHCSGLIVPVWGYELIFRSVLPPLGVQNAIWCVEEVVKEWMTGSKSVFLNLVWF